MSKIYKLGNVNDRNQTLQPARCRNKRQKYIDKKPRFESRKMVLDQVQNI